MLKSGIETNAANLSILGEKLRGNNKCSDNTKSIKIACVD